MIELEDLLALERAVWRALVEGDPAADADALAEDFLGVYPTGFAGRDDHVDQLGAGPTVRRFELAQARMIRIADDAVLLAYHATYVRTGTTADTESMYVSSLWCRRGGRWVNVFSQDTPDTGLPVV